MNEKDALFDALRDQIARALHDWDHGKQESDSPTEPCWFAYRVEADLLIPLIRPHLVTAWERGYQHCVGTQCDNCYSCMPDLVVAFNAYRKHFDGRCCGFCYSAAMGGGR